MYVVNDHVCVCLGLVVLQFVYGIEYVCSCNIRVRMYVYVCIICVCVYMYIYWYLHCGGMVQAIATVYVW